METNVIVIQIEVSYSRLQLITKYFETFSTF